ncbi:hypothetical protein [Alteribacillus sp. YIM 98480]|uniref:hypothetical protein n=1 Tax=Alteribacillus sp. YIM 98480 TaxID=2606599 RepID=UPI00131C25BE|nr:hypothetical protein [Alteribacillus sp. YIM 98480]
MRHDIELSWPLLHETIRARLLTEFHADLCAEIRDTLPFKSIQSHAVVAGKQMYFPYRLLPSSKSFQYEKMNAQPLGRINIELDFQYIAMSYGPMTEPVSALPIAQVIDEDIEKLCTVGEKVWHNLLYSENYIQVLMRESGDHHYA